jgi:hypothetical protein
MAKMSLAFLFLFGAFFVGIKFLTSASKTDKLELLKIASYSILCSVLTLAVLTLIVLFF